LIVVAAFAALFLAFVPIIRAQERDHAERRAAREERRKRLEERLAR
jgi:hypothetical protein